MKIPGVDFGVKNLEGYTVSQLAVMSNSTYYNLDCLKSLVEVEKADFNIRDANGDTPIMWTMKKNMMDRFNVLINCPRVNLNLKDNAGNTIALWALKTNKIETLKTILSKPGIDFNATWVH